MKRKNYDDVLDAISELVDKKKSTKQKVAADNKDLLIKHTKDYFAEIEDLVANKVATYELLLRSFTSYKIKIRALDPGANVITYWNTNRPKEEIEAQLHNGAELLESIDRVKIIWSNAYSTAHNIDKEITIDQFDCLLRS